MHVQLFTGSLYVHMYIHIYRLTLCACVCVLISFALTVCVLSAVVRETQLRSNCDGQHDPLCNSEVDSVPNFPPSYTHIQTNARQTTTIQNRSRERSRAAAASAALSKLLSQESVSLCLKSVRERKQVRARVYVGEAELSDERRRES